MPPTKKATKADTLSRRPSVPETVTTSRGKELATTAAASRPTRAAAPADRNTTVASSTVAGRKRRAPAATDADEPPKKRGRPAKVTATSLPAKRGRPAKDAATSLPAKRGRPAKAAATSLPAKRDRPAKAAAVTAPAKRGPGRPPKTALIEPASDPGLAPAAKSAGTTKKRGRPAKTAASEEPPKRRGRPARASEPADATEAEQPTPDDETAADHLETKLEDTAQAPVKRGRGRPPKAKGKKAAAVEANDSEATQPAPPPSGRQYWLMKAEQDGHDEILANGKVFNTKFTIDDLRAKTTPEPWDGVRNPTAAKNMREMKQGDLAFFYASGGKTPGIVGIMEVVREHELDATASDPESYGYVADAKKRDKWCVVHVEFRKKLSKPVTRAQLVAARDEGPLAQMQEFLAARLSVSKVSEDEWEYIHTLIEGYEGEDEDVEQNGIPSPPALSSTEAIKGPMPTTDSSSRPVSRSSIGSARLLASASRTGSRAGSVPSSLPGMGYRVKTPQPRAGSVQSPSTGGLMDSIGEE